MSRSARTLLPIVVVAAVLAACGSAVHHESRAARPTGAAPSLRLELLAHLTATVRRGVVTWSGAPVAASFDTTDGLLMAWPLSADGGSGVAELARVDPATGVVEAGALLPAVPEAVVAAGGWLWAAVAGTGSSGATATVWRLAPRSLVVTHRQVLGSVGTAIDMVASGGWLWVAHGAVLTAVSTATGDVGPSVVLAAGGAASVDVSSAVSQVVVDAASGDLLTALISPGGGPVLLQRRSPITGALLASAMVAGVFVSVRLAPPVDGRLWVTLVTGMQGGVRPYDAATLGPAASSCDLVVRAAMCSGSNAVSARVADGSVFVTQPGGHTDNRCIDPRSANTRADLPVPAGQDVLSVGPHGIVVASPGSDVTLYPMPARCVRPPATCRTGQLALTMTNAGVGAGSAVMVGTFENRSSGSCMLAGRPALQLLDAQGAPIAATIGRGPASGPSPASPHEIDVGPGQQASFTITASDGNQLSPPLPACPKATSLRVTPPGATDSLQAPIPAGGGRPAGLIPYPYPAGEPCSTGTVMESALIPGSAAHALCPACDLGAPTMAALRQAAKGERRPPPGRRAGAR